MLELYGSDMSNFSAGGYVWASQAQFNILQAQANMVGSFFRGTIRCGQLPDIPNTSPAAGISVRQLIEIAGNAEVMKPTFYLKTAVVNHNLVFDTQ